MTAREIRSLRACAVIRICRVPVALFLATATCTDVVPSNQVIHGLASVDGNRVPYNFVSVLGLPATMAEGLLAGSPEGSECEYEIRIFSGTTLARMKGTVPNCTLERREPLVLSLNLGDPAPAGTHIYRFE